MDSDLDSLLRASSIRSAIIWIFKREASYKCTNSMQSFKLIGELSIFDKHCIVCLFVILRYLSFPLKRVVISFYQEKKIPLAYTTMLSLLQGISYIYKRFKNYLTEIKGFFLEIRKSTTW